VIEIGLKEKLKKIGPCLWELPKEAKPGMKVPAWLFLSDKLLAQVEEGAIEQAANVAFLPGIYKHSIALPDMHFGYGFPIGGVAALDYETGGLSPGGIGFDINCLPTGTKILTKFGYWKYIEEFEKSKDEELVCFNTNTHKIESAKIIFFLKRKGKLIEFETETGHKIKVTEDHPLLTRFGMKEARFISLGEEVAIYPFKGVEYESLKDDIIISESDIKKIVGNRKKIIVELKNRGLLPLKMNSPFIPILAKLTGFVTGDGCISRRKYRKRHYFYWSTHVIGKEEDLEEISKDIESLGFKCSKTFTQRCESVIDQGKKKIKGITRQVVIPSTSFSVLLLALGVPEGRKSEVKFHVPTWIKKAPKWIKRLYLAGFFGAELTKPVKNEKFGFRPPTLSVNKIEPLVSNGIEFLKELKRLIAEFGIKCTIYTERNAGVINRKGEKTIRLGLRINRRSIIDLWEKIGYEYNKERSILSAQILAYLKFKENFLKKKKEAINLLLKLREKGLQVKQLETREELKRFLNRGVIEEWLYRDVKDVRIPHNFPVPEEFLQAKITNPPSPVVWVRIVNKKSLNKEEVVYDFGVSHPSHNFIANNFISSNCGVRLLRTNLTVEQVRPKLKELLEAIFQNVPSGVGEVGKIKLSFSELDEVLINGAKWAVEHGYGTEKDLEHLEENGCMKGANPSKVSNEARKRGAPQLGTLGAGNHFLEIQKVDKIFLPEVAKVFGIEKEGQVTVLIHTGSRGFGHQVCTDYLKILESRFKDELKKLPDRELVYAPAGTQECEDYFSAMVCAANYAWTNRSMIMHWVRESFVKVLGMKLEDIGLEVVYDICHNICKVEEHEIDGKKVKVFVHRKGATRAFPPGHPEIPKDHQSVGQVVLLPGSMGTPSFILVGAETAKETFYSTAHGSGRVSSRAKMLKGVRGEQIAKELATKGILIRAASWRVVAEEAPSAYKLSEEVALTTELAGISKRVVRLYPLGVVKG